MRTSIAVGLAVALAACVKNVPQDLKSGEDAKYKGAKEVKLENNEARATGIVTYPGGDRVDWKVIELPKDQIGTLELKLRWNPPRPGLDLSFEVYNEYFRVLASAKPNTRKKSRKTSKSLTIENARGKLYVQVYASGRGDAGKYTLTGNWKPAVADSGLDWLVVTLMDPPKLPAVPEPEKPCDPAAFDKKNPACANVCPTPYDATWPACANVCPNPPDPKIKACKLCDPAKLDPCLADCKQYYPECDQAKIDPTNPKCDGVQRRPVGGEVTDTKSVADGTQVTVNLGTEDGVDKNGWELELQDAGGTKLPGSTRVISVGKKSSIWKTTNNAVPGGSLAVVKPKPGAPKKACQLPSP